jgi:EmrB/QacA subfamily drug resistance transporter
MTSAKESIESSDGIDPQIWKVAAVAIAGPFMTQMDSTVVNVSLTAIRQQLHSSIATSQWIVSGYLLALALMLPLNGWLVDRIGAKRLYLGCFSAFTLASLLCGFSQSMGQLICARLIQGMAGGLMAPMAQMMIARVAGKHMARVMGYSAMPILIAPILGPVLAGEILKRADWPWLFYLNLPIGILGLALAALLLPRDEASTQRRTFDHVGFMLISPGLVALLYGLPRVESWDGAAAALAGVLLLAAFAWHAMGQGSAALIDLRLFKIRIFSTAAATQFFANGVFYARQFLVPLYLIAGCALSANQAGRMIAAMGIGMMCSFPMIGTLTERFGCRAVSAGGALLALLGMLPFIWMILAHFSPALTMVSLFLAGAGQGMINIPSMSAAYASVPKEKLPVANTAINIVQRLGGPLATTLMALAMSATAPWFPASGPRSFLFAFGLMIALQLIAVASASRLPWRIHREDATRA